MPWVSISPWRKLKDFYRKHKGPRPLYLKKPEIAQRLPVWFQMSELFLDTEFTDDGLDRVARRLARSSFSLAELDRIFIEEVTPCLWSNLIAVTGEWLIFREEFLEKEIVEKMRRPYGLVMTCLVRKICSPVVEGSWSEVMDEVQRKRAS